MRIKLLMAISVLSLCLQKPRAQTKIVVAQDGSGTYTTVQAALNAVSDNNTQPVVIFIKNGIYKEKLYLGPAKNFVTLLGEDRFKTILTYDDHSGKITASDDTINTMTSYSFLIEANDFSAKNLTIQNEAGAGTGQAVALDIRGDKAAFVHCNIVGDQDVLFAQSPGSREFFEDCYIAGTTDFIFGAATAFFDGCHIHCKRNSHITAASTPRERPFGFVFNNCDITGDTGITKADLGRPWRDYAAVTFLQCNIGSCIAPQGWSNWHDTHRDRTARYAEYRDYGPGANTASRVKWAHQLTDEEAKIYTVQNILGRWVPAK